MDAGTATLVNSIGVEATAPTLQSHPVPVKKGDRSGGNGKENNPKLHNWLIGFGFSWLPVLSYPVVVLAQTGKFKEFLSLVFSDISIIYIGVSLIVSAMNDLEPEDSTRAKLYTFFLALAATVYAGLNFVQRSSGAGTASTVVLITMNIIFVSVPVLAGLCQYLRKNGRRQG